MSSNAENREWLKLWTIHPRSLALLQDWDSRHGVLLASHDESAEEAIPDVVELLSPDHTIEIQPSFSEEQWREATGLLREKEIQQGLFSGPFAKRICLILHRLDECPPWMLSSLQGRFERSPRAFVCIATTKQLEKISGQYRSFFDEWQKTGRPHRNSGKLD
ncbi:MAG: hypothetical protein A2Y76_04210 [Planctomycetes bacterium RBG_13_60_9]|nr:MAG: hypothetical protein A2Y76_04210 [Planctomycetes bacterium RBG_13_60_9]